MTPQEVLEEFVSLTGEHDAHVLAGVSFEGQYLICNPESIDRFEDKIGLLVAMAQEGVAERARWMRAVAWAQGLPVDRQISGWVVLDRLTQWPRQISAGITDLTQGELGDQFHPALRTPSNSQIGCQET